MRENRLSGSMQGRREKQGTLATAAGSILMPHPPTPLLEASHHVSKMSKLQIWAVGPGSYLAGPLALSNL